MKEVKHITHEELLTLLLNLDGKTLNDFTNVVLRTEVTMLKTGNPYYGKVFKNSSRNYRLISNYEQRVKNNDLKEGGEGNFESKKPSGRHHISDLVTVDDKTNSIHYLNLEYFVEVKPQVNYEMEGQPIDKTIIEPFLSKKYENKSQPQERKVDIITPKLTSICGITLEGTKYIVGN